ncbi:hypothetical protein [Lihuaxuella thermophila]|uniref:Uncharacterized protein n=1 Tax=Lihuaxuella thermophila TaxID=1173111 RepID=A0A1H8ES32_9BACL|nr:hypothetical protein [Lihuaxuella thermophila]SEN22303.1 hypothetical protein SAMN05444955_107142 [Lihuaxuella thermophila]
MSHPGDNLVLILLIGVIFYFLLRNWISFSFLTDWLHKSADQGQIEIRGDVPDLLKKNGYEVIKAKQRVPITIDVDDRTYESRFYVDYIARADDEWYLVIVARERKPVRMSGPALRDYFLPYYLLYQPEGILYVNREKRTIQLIQFDFPDVSLSKKQGFPWLYIAAVLFGMILAWLIR